MGSIFFKLMVSITYADLSDPPRERRKPRPPGIKAPRARRRWMKRWNRWNRWKGDSSYFSKGDFIFQASILGGYVSFQGGGRPFVAEMEMILKIYVNFEGPCWFEGGYLMTSGHRQIIWYSWKNILGVDRSRGSKWRFTMENFQSLHIHQRFATLYSFCWENCFSFWQRAWCKSTFWWTTNVMCHYWSKVQIGLLLAPQKKTQTQSHEGFLELILFWRESFGLLVFGGVRF